MPKVLIVDDSPTARDMLASILGNDPDLEVIGYAENGTQAVDAAKKLRPDVITMDLNMPVMNGFEATREIMYDSPTPIVVVTATSRAKEVETAMAALQAGALNLLLKPVGPRSPEFESRARDIVNTVKTMAGVYVIRRHRLLAGDSPPLVVAPAKVGATVGTKKIATEVTKSSKDSPLGLIAIAASTGGPPALAKVLGALPKDFPVPVLVVQHIVAGFIEGFAQWLGGVVPPNVKLAVDHEMLKSGTVYIAPQDHHLGVTSRRIRLSDSEPIAGFRPAANYMFERVADAYGSSAAGVILTGMGDDGVKGLMQIRENGGATIAQDQETSAVFGMPRAAIQANCIDTVLPLEEIGEHLCKLATRSSAVR